MNEGDCRKKKEFPTVPFMVCSTNCAWSTCIGALRAPFLSVPRFRFVCARCQTVILSRANMYFIWNAFFRVIFLLLIRFAYNFCCDFIYSFPKSMRRSNLHSTSSESHGRMQLKLTIARVFISLLLPSLFSLSPCRRLDATCPVSSMWNLVSIFFLISPSSLNKWHNQCENECRVHAAKMAAKLCATRSTKWASDRHVRSFIQMMTATRGSGIYTERARKNGATEKNWKLNSLILHSVRCVIKLC